MPASPRLTVVGSINLDFVVQAERLPRPGETLSGARFLRVPGGKGANQAVAAARLGARVSMVGAVGRDEHAEAALAGVNRLGLEARGERAGLVCVTRGAEGAVLLEDGEEVARAAPPSVEAVDGTAAGDAFTACLVVSLLEGRARKEALRRACAAG